MNNVTPPPRLALAPAHAPLPSRRFLPRSPELSRPHTPRLPDFQSSRHACWFWRLAGLALTAGGALWARDYFSVGSGGVLNGSVMRQR